MHSSAGTHELTTCVSSSRALALIPSFILPVTMTAEDFTKAGSRENERQHHPITNDRDRYEFMRKLI